MTFEYIRPSQVSAGDIVQLGDGLWEILDEPVRGDGTLGKPAGAFFAAGRRFSAGAWGPERNTKTVTIRTDMAPLRISRDEFKDLSVCYGYAMNFNAAGEGRGI
jgi:hypothetical protein|nr:MAG TPA: hypothetical protein [Caudoviricetes sp.]